MITETTYSPHDLTHGRCVSCGETSDEILRYDEWGEDIEKDDMQCIGCIESDKFYDATMEGV